MSKRIRYTADQRLAMRRRWLAALKLAHERAGSNDRLVHVLNAQPAGLRAGYSFYERCIRRWQAGDGPTLRKLIELLPLMEAVAEALKER